MLATVKILVGLVVLCLTIGLLAVSLVGCFEMWHRIWSWAKSPRAGSAIGSLKQQDGMRVSLTSTDAPSRESSRSSRSSGTLRSSPLAAAEVLDLESGAAVPGVAAAEALRRQTPLLLNKDGEHGANADVTSQAVADESTAASAEGTSTSCSQLASDHGVALATASEAFESSLRSSKPLPYLNDMEDLETLGHSLRACPIHASEADGQVVPIPEDCGDSLAGSSCRPMPYLESDDDGKLPSPSPDDGADSLAPGSCKALPYISSNDEGKHPSSRAKDGESSLDVGISKPSPNSVTEDEQSSLSADQAMDSLDVRSCRPLPYLDTEAWQG